MHKNVVVVFLIVCTNDAVFAVRYKAAVFYYYNYLLCMPCIIYF
jgi:hypothetical protein